MTLFLRSGLLLALLSLPVLTATVSCSKKENATPVATTGGIEGTISPATAVATVTATSTGNVIFLQTPAASGTFAFANLAPGAYTLSCATQPGFVPTVRNVTVVAGQVTAVSIEVAPEPLGSIEGIIVPVGAVTRVDLVNANSGTVTPAVPDATTGAFRANLVRGSYMARFVVAPGYTAVPDQTNLQLGLANMSLRLGIVFVQRSTIALTATLNGIQEVPANATSATGIFMGSYNLINQQLTYTINYQMIAPINAHIHIGAPGVTGPVSVSFTSLISPIQGTVTLTATQANDLLNDRMYINIHSAAFPAGEIRGNIHQ